MKSRERVKKVLNHEIPDKVPVDFGSTRTTGITAIAYNKLIKKLSLNLCTPKMFDIVQQLVYPQKEIRGIFNVDFIDAGQAFNNSNIFWREFVLRDDSKCLVPAWINIVEENDKSIKVIDDEGTLLGIMPPKSLYIDQCFWVYGKLSKFPKIINKNDFKKDLWDYATPPPTNIDFFDYSESLKFKENIEKLYEETDYAIVLRFGGNLVESGFSIRGMENYFCDLYLDESGVNNFLDILMDDYMKNLERILELVGEYISVIMFADDMGSEIGPFFQKEIYKKYFKERHKKMWELVHRKSDCKVFLHSCGSIYELIPDLIDAGLDILSPVQITAKDMQPEKLKKQFGKYLIFWGGCCDSRKVLSSGSPVMVTNHVKKNMKILGNDGGLIFSPIHNVQPEVSPENILSLFKAADMFGNY